MKTAQFQSKYSLKKGSRPPLTFKNGKKKITFMFR